MSQTRLGCWQRLEFRVEPRRTPLAPTPLLSCCIDGGGPLAVPQNGVMSIIYIFRKIESMRIINPTIVHYNTYNHQALIYPTLSSSSFPLPARRHPDSSGLHRRGLAGSAPPRPSCPRTPDPAALRPLAALRPPAACQILSRRRGWPAARRILPRPAPPYAARRLEVEGGKNVVPAFIKMLHILQYVDKK
jgi:hypothetical protein